MNLSPALKDRVAIVTGGGRGIGKSITQRLAAAGAQVVIASRKVENLEATAREFASLPGRVIPIACHVGHREALEDLGKADHLARRPRRYPGQQQRNQHWTRPGFGGIG